MEEEEEVQETLVAGSGQWNCCPPGASSWILALAFAPRLLQLLVAYHSFLDYRPPYDNCAEQSPCLDH